MPAPATRPMFQPRLKPCGPYSARSASIERAASACTSAASSAESAPKSPVCVCGATSTCPDEYGNLFMTTSARSPRWTRSSSSGSQKMQRSSSSACWTYSSRHGAQSGSGIKPLEPALVAEEGHHAADRGEHQPADRPEPGARSLARKDHVHAEDARDHEQREHDERDDREDLEHLVLPVRHDRLVRRLERLDHFLVVVEHVPDALGAVDDVLEVELEVLRQEALDLALEQTERRAFRLHDLAVADDLLLDVRDVAHDLFGTAFEDVVLERVELVADLVEDREAVVEEVVEQLVEQAAGAAREQLLAERLVVFAALEQPRHRQQLHGRERHQVVGADEEVELAGVQPLDRAVVDREVEDAEEV